MNSSVSRGGKGAGMIVIALLVVLVLGGIIYTASQLLSGGDDTVETRPDITKGSYGVRMQVLGAVQADENFESYSITVTPTQRSVSVSRGYSSAPLADRAYDNNTPAFEDFAVAIDRLGFGDQVGAPEMEDGYKGACPTGTRYLFETISPSGSTVATQWTTTCRSQKGTLDRGASVRTIRQLFEKQIPDLKEVKKEVDQYSE